jgi:DNA-3-methyladenine glycosylase II
MIRTKIFAYDDKAVQHLQSVDENFNELINKLGKVEREVIPDIFTALVNAIVGQLISTMAAKSIWGRLVSLLKEITPQVILNTDISLIKDCGLTNKKTRYIYNLAKAVSLGVFVPQKLYSLSDEEIIKELTKLDGIGKWTAQMILINSLERLDVISYDDSAIRNAMCKLYNLDKISIEEFNIYRNRYSPYASVASIYLWKYSSIK